MVSEAGRSDGCARYPAVGTRADGELDAQAMVVIAEVIEAADDVHSGAEGLTLVGQTTYATVQPDEALANGGIEPFDMGGVAYASLLRVAQQRIDGLLRALHYAMSTSPDHHNM